jgi:hypothetical protein
MEEITPEQFLENLKNWKPEAPLKELIAGRLRQARVREEFQGELAQALQDCSESTYHYIQHVNELASTHQLDRKNLAPEIARLVALVEDLREKGRNFQAIFGRYDESARSELTHDHFDTVYFDAIQDIDIRVLLKNVFDEVGAVLKAFSLAASELRGVSCLDLYEHSIRFQLFLRYFLTRRRFAPEEIWSVLFDASSQFSEILKKEEEPTESELADLENSIERFKKNPGPDKT